MNPEFSVSDKRALCHSHTGLRITQILPKSFQLEFCYQTVAMERVLFAARTEPSCGSFSHAEKSGEILSPAPPSRRRRENPDGRRKIERGSFLFRIRRHQIADNSFIQYAVGKALAAGIIDMLFITERNRCVTEYHFDTACKVETELAARRLWAEACRFARGAYRPHGSSSMNRFRGAFTRIAVTSLIGSQTTIQSRIKRRGKLRGVEMRKTIIFSDLDGTLLDANSYSFQ